MVRNGTALSHKLERDWSEVTRLVSTQNVGIKTSILSQASNTAVVINLIKHSDFGNFALNYCAELLKRRICTISTKNFIENNTVEVDYNRDIDSGGHSICSVVIQSQSGSLQRNAT